MLDPKLLAARPEEVEEALALRGGALSLAPHRRLAEERRRLLQEVDALRHRSKEVSARIPRAKETGESITPLLQEAAEVKGRLKEEEESLRRVEEEVRALALQLPNLPREDTPRGASEEENVEVRRWGAPQEFTFPARDHVALGEGLGLLDLPAAGRLSGARFALLRGAGPRLERALTTLLLDLHAEAGYQEVSVPFLVTEDTMQGTGQLPKFEEDLFKTSHGERPLYLIPTGEVPLTNLHAGQVLPLEELPLRYTAITPCFRREAGSHGRDTRGLIRLHQFSKVELVNFVPLEEAPAALEAMVAHVERCLQLLGLTYRVVDLCTGDLGFSARKTYDLEVWMPGQGVYREISSCSDCGDFQARRMGLRGRGPQGERREVATLNGSALPLGRLVAALLEQGQQEDGSVLLPDALAPLMGAQRLLPSS